jgi:hypothetical protein
MTAVKRVRKLSTLLLIVASCLAIPVKAQFDSAIEGIVSDTTGAVIPDVQVVLTNVDTGVSRRTTTSSGGYYRFPSLPPGKYRLTATKPGFDTVVQEDIILEAVRVQSVPITMKPGALVTQVTVTGAPPAVETTEAHVSGLTTGIAVHDLPLAGRNILDVVAQTPGVTGIGMVGDWRGGNDIFNLVSGAFINANGQRGSSNGYYVDDTSVNDNPDGGGAKLAPNIESVQELRVSVNNYSAQYGRNSSVMTQVVTKSGTNDLHGSLFWYHQDNALTSRTYLQNTPDVTGHIIPTFRRNEFGGSAGGPLRKDRTFVFGSWDQLRQVVPNSGLTTVETPEFVNFMKTNYPNHISTYVLSNFPASVSSFIPGTIETVADVMAANNLGPCTGAGPLGMPCNMPIVGNAVYSFTNPRPGLQWNVRLDEMFSNEKDRLYGNFFRMTTSPFSANVRSGFSGPSPGYTDYLGLNWTHLFSSVVVNEAAFGFTRNYGEGPCFNCRIPSMSISGLAGFGTGWGPGVFVQNDFHWRDVLSLNRGRHALKTGLDIYRDQDNAPFTPPLLRPGFDFHNVFDFAADQPYDEWYINFNAKTGGPPFQDYAYRSSTYGFFVQDDWKAKSNLSLNLGLRWDFSSNPKEHTNNMTNLKLGPGATFQERIANAVLVHVPAMFTEHRIGYFAPRFGFAWDPTNRGKTSIRGGFGVFFDRWPNKAWSDVTRGNPPNVANVYANVSNPSPPYPLLALGKSDRVPFGFPLPQPLPIGLNPAGGPIAGLATVGGVDPGLRYAYAENWFLGVQRAFGSKWVLEADYMGSVGHHLYTVIDRNRYSGDAILHKGTLTRLNPYFATMNYSDNNGNSAFQGGTVALRKTFSRGFTFQTAYTFGKTIDYSNDRSTGSGSTWANVFDAWNYKAQRGLSEIDVPQKLAFNFVFQLPQPSSSNRLVNGFLGGWEASSLGVLQKGQPYGVYTTATDYNGDGTYYDRPDTPSWGNSKSGLSRSDYIRGVFSAADFPVPPPGQEGNLGRNTFRGPGFAQVDFSLIKNNHIPWFVREGGTLQVRAEFYNLFNRVNLSGWDTNLADGTFGKATGSYQARALQVGLRIQF